MAYVGICSDQRNNVLAIDAAGNLRLNRLQNRLLSSPGLGDTIGGSAAWAGYSRIAAGYVDGFGVMFTAAPGAAYLTVTPASGTGSWQNINPVQDPNGAVWGVPMQVFTDSYGSLFVVDYGGVLWRRRYEVYPNAPVGEQIVSNPALVDVAIASGWGHWANVFVCGTRVFALDENGVLHYWTRSSNALDFGNGDWKDIGGGWGRFLRVFAASPTSLYAVHSEGALVEYPFTDDGTTVTFLPTSTQVGGGFIGWSGLPCLVEGYSVPQSVSPADTISFRIATRVSGSRVTRAVPCDIDYVRLRRMRDGAEADYDVVMQVGPRQQQITPQDIPDDETLLACGAEWAETTSLVIPASWGSGMYAARCTDAGGNRFYIPFVVRSATKRAPFAVLANTNTWNTYNSWGGLGKYVHRMPLPRTLPVQRPHPGLTPDVVPASNSVIMTQTHHLLRAELWVLGWLDGLGDAYAYDLYTDWDLHTGIPGLERTDGAARYKALILTVHPEYWTFEEYDHAMAYQKQGGSIVYLGGNGVYEQVVLTGPSDSMGIFPGIDWATQPGNASNESVRVHCLLRVLGRPEFALLGVGFNVFSNTSLQGQAYVVQSPPVNPMLAGVAPAADGTIGDASADTGVPSGPFKVSGWEVDQRSLASSVPPGLSPAAACAPEALLATATPDPAAGGEMLYYETGCGGVVFAGSSLNFGGSLAVDANLQRIVTNVLDECLKR